MAIVPKAERAGEEGHYSLEVPAGYVYCCSSIRTISVVPATGDRGLSHGSDVKRARYCSLHVDTEARHRPRKKLG